jgi:hypothetical protein
VDETLHPTAHRFVSLPGGARVHSIHEGPPDPTGPAQEGRGTGAGRSHSGASLRLTAAERNEDDFHPATHEGSRQRPVHRTNREDGRSRLPHL